jgi:type I restriction enzyme S subunit
VTWADVPLLEAVDDVSAGSVKIPQSALLPAGELPVVDQGRSVVAGFTDNMSAAVQSQLPLIVFGDHTRAIKYIDFPFAMGADGVKLLRPREGFDPKFLYRFLQWREVPSAGYSRHFKFLKELRVPRPPLSEQRRIAGILDQADVLRAKRRQTLAHVDALPQAIFQEWFGEPLENPRSLPVQPLRDWIDPSRPITYGILKPGPDVAGGEPYVRVADMQDRGINLAGIRRTTREIATEYRRSVLRPGDLLMSIRGHVGRFAVVPMELSGANITQDSARLAVSDPLWGPYVRAAMESPTGQHWLASRTKGAAVRGINLGDLREFPLPRPQPSEMVRFAESLQALDRARDRMVESLARCEEVFASLRRCAFAGEL